MFPPAMPTFHFDEFKKNFEVEKNVKNLTFRFALAKSYQISNSQKFIFPRLSLNRFS